MPDKKQISIHCFIITMLSLNIFCEKKEQLFKKGDLSDAVSTMKAIIERQQNEEIMALYGSGP